MDSGTRPVVWTATAREQLDKIVAYIAIAPSQVQIHGVIHGARDFAAWLEKRGRQPDITKAAGGVLGGGAGSGAQWPMRRKCREARLPATWALDLGRVMLSKSQSRRAALVLILGACLACDASRGPAGGGGTGGSGGTQGSGGGGGGGAGGNGVPLCAVSCVEATPAPQDAGLGSCAFGVPDSVRAASSNIGVRADGVRVSEDPTHVDGWAYTDQTGATIQIFGPTCDAIIAGTVSSICFDCVLGPA